VHLSSPQNCNLGLHLDTCRVKILNREAFPTDVYKEEVQKGKPNSIKKIDDWGLFFEYCKLNFESGEQQWQTVMVLIFDQLSSIFLFVTLWVGVYIVDTVFARGLASRDRLIVPDRYHTAIVIALWYVLPVVVLYIWDTAKVHIDIKGGSRMFLQNSLMRTCLDYTPESRNGVTSTNIHIAMGVSADQIAIAYDAALKVVGLLGRILAVEIFIIVFQNDTLAIYSVVAMVAAMLIFVALRVGIVEEARDRVEERWLLMETLVEESNLKYRLLTDYAKKGLMTDMFGLAVQGYSNERIPDALIHLNTQYATKLLSGICIANYIVQRAPGVLSGEVPLGMFLATITIFGVYLSDAINGLNDQLILIVDSFIPLKDFTQYLNLPQELVARKKVNMERRRQTNLKRSTTLKAHATPRTCIKSDRMPIVVSDLTFKYEDRSVNDDVFKYEMIFNNINLSIPQGQMIAVIGPHNSGKSTFVQLLSDIIHPTSGSIFVPSHLQVLHVAREPMFLHASILHNLSLGLADPSQIDLKRARKILNALGLQDVVEMIDKDLKLEGDHHDENAAEQFMEDELKLMASTETSWERSLTQSRKVKLHVARALIADPDVMILDRALQSLHEDAALEVLQVLKQHVQEKGLFLSDEEQAEQETATRRPRTVFFSTAVCLHMADSILQIDPEKKSISMTDRGGLASSIASMSPKIGQMCSPKH